MKNKTARKFSPSEGFTLIELVVAFSIMAILGTVGIASFVSYSRSQSLQQATNDLTMTINTARAKSLAQVSNICSGSGVFNGYDVVISTNSYNLNAECSGSNVLIKSTPFPTGVSLHNPPSPPITITFAVLSGGVTVTPTAANIQIDGVSGSKKFTIDSGGNIQFQP